MMSKGDVPSGTAAPGESTVESNSSVTETPSDWREDPLFEAFLAPDYDERTYVTSAVKGTGVVEVLDSLTSGLERIESDIRSKVVRNHDSLLEQAAKMETVDADLKHVTVKAQSLRRRIKRIKADMIMPFQRVEQLTVQLKNVQLLCSTMRLCHRFSLLVKKLREALKATKKASSARDLSKAAALYSEINNSLDEGALRGVEIVENDIPFVESAGDLIRQQGRNYLWKAMDAMNQTDMGSSLLVFFRLGPKELVSVIDATSNKLLRRIRDSVKEMVDVSALGDKRRLGRSFNRSKDASTKDKSTSWRATMWSRIDSVGDSLLVYVLQMWNLETVIIKKKDPFSHTLFIDAIDGYLNGLDPHDNDSPKLSRESSIMSQFWQSSTEAIAEELKAAAKSSNFLENLFVNEFPRLSSIFHSLFERVRNGCHPVASDRFSGHGYPLRDRMKFGESERTVLMSSVSTYRSQFLAGTLSKLNEPVNLMFAGGSHDAVPTTSDVAAFVSSINNALEEVRKAEFSVQMEVARAVTKAVQLFATHCENMVDSSVDSNILQGNRLSSPSAHNAEIHRIVYHLKRSLSSVKKAEDLDEKARDEILKGVTSLQDVDSVLMGVMMKQSCSALELYICVLPSESYGESSHDLSGNGSPFIMELRSKTKIFMHSVLSHYQSEEVDLGSHADIMSRLKNMAARLIRVFVINASLVSPISEQGRVKLAGDIGQFESIIRIITPFPEESALFPLQLFKNMLFSPMNDVVSSEEFKALGQSVVIQHLISRTKLPGSSCCGPHVVLGWTAKEYLAYVDAYTDAETCSLLSTVVDKIEDSIDIPMGPSGKHYVAKNFPELSAAASLLPQ